MIIARADVACINKSAIPRIRTLQLLGLFAQQRDDLRPIRLLHLAEVPGIRNPGQQRDDRHDDQ